MTTLTLQIRSRAILREVNKLAKEKFRGNASQAALDLIEKGTKQLADAEPKTTNGNGRSKQRKRIKDLTSLPFYGMWADREDMKGKDSVEWVNEMRRTRTERRRARHGSR